MCLCIAVFIICTKLEPNPALTKRWKDSIDYGDSRPNVSSLITTPKCTFDNYAAPSPERPIVNALCHDARHHPRFTGHCVSKEQGYGRCI